MSLFESSKYFKLLGDFRDGTQYIFPLFCAPFKTIVFQVSEVLCCQRIKIDLSALS